MKLLVRSFAAAVFLAVIAAPAAWADLSQLPAPLDGTGGECDLKNGTNPCSTILGAHTAIGGNSSTLNGNVYIGARSIAGSSSDTAIHAFNYCYYVNNNSTNSLFIPFNTEPEWTSFVDNHPAGVTLQDCSIPANISISPNFGSDPRSNQCVGAPVPSSIKISTWYAPYTAGLTYPQQAPLTFNCMSADKTAFTETADPIISAEDSGHPVTMPGWVLTSISYTYNGSCGTAAGTASATAPGTDLCHVGAATTPTKVGANWQWTCQAGDGGGTSDTCTAPTLSCSAIFPLASGNTSFVVPSGGAIITNYTLVGGGGGGGGGGYYQGPSASGIYNGINGKSGGTTTISDSNDAFSDSATGGAGGNGGVANGTGGYSGNNGGTGSSKTGGPVNLSAGSTLTISVGGGGGGGYPYAYSSAFSGTATYGANGANGYGGGGGTSMSLPGVSPAQAGNGGGSLGNGNGGAGGSSENSGDGSYGGFVGGTAQSAISGNSGPGGGGGGGVGAASQIVSSKCEMGGNCTGAEPAQGGGGGGGGMAIINYQASVCFMQ